MNFSHPAISCMLIASAVMVVGCAEDPIRSRLKPGQKVRIYDRGGQWSGTISGGRTHDGSPFLSLEPGTRLTVVSDDDQRAGERGALAGRKVQARVDEGKAAGVIVSIFREELRPL